MNGLSFIRNLISRSWIEYSVYELMQFSNSVIEDALLKKEIANKCFLLSSEFLNAKWSYEIGSISAERWLITQNKIISALLSLIDDIEFIESKKLGADIKTNVLEFSKIDIMSELCIWQNRTEEVIEHSPIYSFHEKVLSKNSKKLNNDPILEVVILNKTEKPIIIIEIGILPIYSRHDIKGIPTSGRVIITERYVLEVKEFEFGVIEILKIADPIYMEALAPFRFTLELKNYKKAARIKGNNTVIKLLIKVGNSRVESPLIKMGMF